MLKLRLFIGIILILLPLFWFLGIENVATSGGILLILGSLFVFSGQIYYSVFVYFLADIAWITIAYQNNDVSGVIFVSIGMALGFLAWLKMNYGKMRKTLEW